MLATDTSAPSGDFLPRVTSRDVTPGIRENTRCTRGKITTVGMEVKQRGTESGRERERETERQRRCVCVCVYVCVCEATSGPPCPCSVETRPCVLTN